MPASGKKRSRPGVYHPNATAPAAWIAGIVGLLLVAGLVFAAVRHPAPPAPGTGSLAGLPVGATVPTLSLSSTAGRSISLSAYGGKKVVLFFYEGAGCGPCQEQLVELQSDLGAIRADGGVVLAASTDSLSMSTSLAAQLHLGFPILSDKGGRLGSAFGIFALTGGMNMGQVDRHSIFVINGHGKVSWKRLSLNQMHVPMTDILSALRST